MYNKQVYQEERALYNIKNDKVIECVFEGAVDGESPLKECKNIIVDKCMVNLRYPFWHNDNLILSNSIMKDNCRAPFWYCNQIVIDNVTCDGVKAVRECDDVLVTNSTFNSEEFGWKSKNLNLKNSSFTGHYFLFDTDNVKVDNITLNGKYSFQYMKNVMVENSTLNTKDAFWHAKNVVIINSTLKGEYIAWYSSNLTFINCKISGTQPFCYCKNLRLINCELEDADFAFENSQVNATLNGKVISIKNPLKGNIKINGQLDELIIQDYTKTPKGKVYLNGSLISK